MEQLVEFKTAKLANEKGFRMLTLDSNLYYCATKEGQLYSKDMCTYFDLCNESNSTTEKYLWIPAPSQAILQEWIRDVHKIHIAIEFNINSFISSYEYTLQHIVKCNNISRGSGHKSYTEALGSGLHTALSIIEKA